MSDQSPHSLQVVSPQMPCGAAWLANALLELGVAIDNLWGFDTAAEWQVEPDGSRCYVATHGPWRQTLASLWPDRRFPPPIGPCTIFSHQLPHHLPSADRRILMVRDPRDALYSEWKRHLRNAGSSSSFEDFLVSEFFDSGCSQSDYLWSFLTAWLDAWAAQSVPTLLVRFEDFKRRPVQALNHIVRWLGLNPSPESIRRACEVSDVSHLQKIEKAIAKNSQNSREFNRRGKAFEWRIAWPSAWHQAFGDRWRKMLDQLRYPPCVLTDAPRGEHTAALRATRQPV